MVVVPIETGNVSDVGGMLRKLADEIDAGEHGDVRLAVTVVRSTACPVSVFGAGRDGDAGSAFLLLHAGAAKLMQMEIGE